MKKHPWLKSTALAAGIGCAGAANAAILFDVNGDTAAGGVTAINEFDWRVDNMLMVDLIPTGGTGSVVNFDMLVQGAIHNSSIPGDRRSTDLAGILDSGTEVTYQASMEASALVNSTSGGTVFTLTAIGGGVFDVFYDDTGSRATTGGLLHDNLLGTGYGDGRGILSGTVLSAAAGELGSLNIFSTNEGPLDQFNTDNQSPITTVSVNGSIFNFDVEIDSFDASFFPADFLGNTIDVDGEPDLNHSADHGAPFQQVNPSDSIVGVAPDYGTDNVNDNACAAAGQQGPDRCDLHVQSDTSTAFNADLRIVPEPGTLALLGLGVLGFGAQRRLRKG